MTGYHLTSLDCWRKISEVGLLPYPINQHPDILSVLLEEGLMAGIWIWPNLPRGLDLVGCAMDRIISKQSTAVVLLAVDYNLDEVIRPDYRWIHDGQMTHDSVSTPWVYHCKKPFWILRNPVPLSRLRVVFYVDLEQVLEQILQDSMELSL